MVRVVFIDLEVWKDPERVFKIGAIRRDLNNIEEFMRVKGHIEIPEDIKTYEDGYFKDKASGCDCFYFEIDRDRDENDYAEAAKEAFAKLKSFSLNSTDKTSIKDIYLCGHNIIRFDSKYIEEYWDDSKKTKTRTDLEDKSEEEIKEYMYIDTLTVSPLIFPEFPSHKLNKDYKQESEKDDTTVNNPVEDSRICMNLLLDQIERLEWMSENSRDIVATMIDLVHSGDSKDKKSDLIVQWDNFLNMIHDLNKDSKIPHVPQLDEENSDEVLAQNVKRLIETGSLKGNLCIHGMDKFNYAQKKEWQIPLAYMLANIYANSKMSGNAEPINNAIIPYYVQYRYKGIDRINWDLRGIQCDDKDCLYCHNKDGKSAERFDLEMNLKRYWGEEYCFRKFPMYDGQITKDGKQEKDLQRDASGRALKGGNLLAIFPTGGGKSLSFQLPALMQWRLMGALTVVISPLQSLMNDQVDSLDEKGMVGEAVTKNGSQNERKQRAGILQARNGSASMLYISPESLKNPRIKSILLSRTIARFVIDESHCFSQWGMDFRPDYRYIPQFIRELEESKGLDKLDRPGIPVSCFTATASNNTRDDIRNSFNNLKESKDLFALKDIFVDSQRTNLSYELIEVPRPKDVKPEDMNQEIVFNEKLRELKKLLLDINKNDKTEPIIIYISNTKKTEEIANWICNDEDLKVIGKARPFYGQQSRSMKNKTQAMFMNGKCRIIVATSAFGMGVDKDNVRNVIHFGISNSVEDYVQEAGRAGRDNNPANCYLLYMEDEDLAYVDFLSESSKLRLDIIQKVWKYLNDCVSETQKKYNEPKVGYTVSKIINAIENELPIEGGRREKREYVKRILNFLTDKGYLENLPDVVSAFPTKINIDASSLIDKAFPQKTLMNDLANYVVARIREYKKEGNIKEVGDLYSDLFTYAKEEEKKITLDDINYLFRELEKHNIITCEEEKEFVIDRPSNTHSVEDLEAWKTTELEMLEKLTKRSYLSFEALKADSENVTDGVNRLKQIFRFWVDHKYINRAKSIITFMEYTGSNPSESGQKDNKGQSSDSICIKERISKRYANAKKIFEKYNDSKEFYTLSELQGLCDKTGRTDIQQLEEALDILARTELLSIDDGGVIFRRKSYALIKKKEIDEKDFEEIKDYYEKKDKQVFMYLPDMTEKMKSESLTQFFHDYFWEDRKVFDSRIKEKKHKAPEFDIDEEKKAVLKDNISNIIIVKAGPGSGKTRLMVLKAEWMIQNREANPSDIVMLTRTRKAAEEISSRLKNNMRGITATTFHSYAASIKGEPGGIEEDYLSQAAGLLENAKQNLDGFMSRTIPGMPEMDAVRKRVIIIDEAQDMRKDMYELIQKLYELNKAMGNSMKICAVGDPDQAIFDYARTDSDRTDYMNKLRELDKEKTEIYSLNKNYRSCQAIVELSRKYLNKDYKKDDAVDDSDATIGVYNTSCPEKALVEELFSNLSVNDKGKSIAVLSFTNEMKYELRNMIKHSTNGKISGEDVLINDLKREGMEDFTLEKLDEFHAILRRISTLLEGSTEKLSWAVIKNEVFDDFHNIYKNSRYCEIAIDLVKKYFITMEEDEIFGEKEYEKLLKYLKSIPFRKFEKEIIRKESPSQQENSINLTLSTIHSAKGREYDAVYIYHDRYFDRINKKDSCEDAIKELYVAMTRAKSELYIFSTRDICFPRADGTIKEMLPLLEKCKAYTEGNLGTSEGISESEKEVTDKSVYADFSLRDLVLNQYMNKWWYYKYRGYENRRTNPLIEYEKHFYISANDWKGFFDDSPEWMQAGVCKARFVRTIYEYFKENSGWSFYPGLIWLEIRADNKTDWGKKECCSKTKAEEIESFDNICKKAIQIQNKPENKYTYDMLRLCGDVDIRAVVIENIGGSYRKFLLP